MVERQDDFNLIPFTVYPHCFDQSFVQVVSFATNPISADIVHFDFNLVTKFDPKFGLVITIIKVYSTFLDLMYYLDWYFELAIPLVIFQSIIRDSFKRRRQVLFADRGLLLADSWQIVEYPMPTFLASLFHHRVSKSFAILTWFIQSYFGQWILLHLHSTVLCFRDIAR